MSVPTPSEIEAARTPRGGWTRETLAGWGVPWPPPRGWLKALAGGESIPHRSPLSAAQEARVREIITEMTGAVE